MSQRIVNISEIQEIIELDYIWNNLFENNPLPKKEEILEQLEKKINADYKTKMTYFLVIITIGKHLQIIQKQLKNKYLLDLRSVEGIVNFKTHPLYKDEIKRINYKEVVGLAKNPSRVLSWNNVIEDYMLALSKHIKGFIFVGGRKDYSLMF